MKDYVREQGLRSREVFVPLSHSPGHAQADFGEAMAVIGGALRKIHFLAFDLSATVMVALLRPIKAETTEAFCDGHNAAFAWSSAASPDPSCTDNDQAGGCPDPGRWEAAFRDARLHGASVRHYLFEDRVRPAGQSGNDKGKVEGLEYRLQSGGTSWSPSRVPRASRPSTMLSPNSAAGARRRGCGAYQGDHRRASRAGSSGFSCHCRLLPMMRGHDACDKRPVF